MTEEMIGSITVAETRATEIKNAAQEKATRILADAELQATRKEKSSAEVCKAYAETQLKAVRLEAEERYEETLKTKKAEAKAYCVQIVKNAEDAVIEIVGRILSGDR